jgi:hypothetical protein
LDDDRPHFSFRSAKNQPVPAPQIDPTGKIFGGAPLTWPELLKKAKAAGADRAREELVADLDSDDGANKAHDRAWQFWSEFCELFPDIDPCASPSCESIRGFAAFLAKASDISNSRHTVFNNWKEKCTSRGDQWGLKQFSCYRGAFKALTKDVERPAQLSY